MVLLPAALVAGIQHVRRLHHLLQKLTLGVLMMMPGAHVASTPPPPTTHTYPPPSHQQIVETIESTSLVHLLVQP